MGVPDLNVPSGLQAVAVLADVIWPVEMVTITRTDSQLAIDPLSPRTLWGSVVGFKGIEASQVKRYFTGVVQAVHGFGHLDALYTNIPHMRNTSEVYEGCACTGTHHV